MLTLIWNAFKVSFKVAFGSRTRIFANFESVSLYSATSTSITLGLHEIHCFFKVTVNWQVLSSLNSIKIITPLNKNVNQENDFLFQIPKSFNISYLIVTQCNCKSSIVSIYYFNLVVSWTLYIHGIRTASNNLSHFAPARIM